MTKQQSLKQRIRARMKKTGERYTTARSHILKIHQKTISPQYADFLDLSAAILQRPKLKKAATLFRESGEFWKQFANLIAQSEDKALARACEITNERAALGDQSGENCAIEMLALWKERESLRNQCQLKQPQSKKLYSQLAEALGAVIEKERQAVDILKLDS